MEKRFFIYLFILVSNWVDAQLYHSNWIFTFENYIKFHHSNQSNTLENLPLVFNRDILAEGSTTISDFNGNLLLYTNGEDVYNQFHEKLNHEPLLGFTGNTQSSVIIPYPGHYNQFVLITTYGSIGLTPDIAPAYWNYMGVNYYLINLNKNNGHGELITPPHNQLLPHSSQKINYTKHQNGKDYWALTFKENKFYAFLINQEGIHSPVISEVPFRLDERGHSPSLKGQLKFSPNGEKIGIVHKNVVSSNNFHFYSSDMQDYEGTVESNPDDEPGVVLAYDFDKSNGRVTNEIKIFQRAHTLFGLEFSPSGRYLFFTYNDKNASGISYYDLELNQLRNAYAAMDFSHPFQKKGSMQLGIDGRIYHAQNEANYLNCINNPDDIITYPADYKVNCQPIQKVNSNGLSNFPSFYLNQSIKVYNAFDEHNACINTPLTFWINTPQVIESAFWDFGDGTTSTEHAPTHIYNIAGTYTLNATINGKNYTHSITIHEPINIPEYSLKECNVSNTTDVWFNLEKFTQFLGNRVVYISYHATRNDAEQNLNAFDNLIVPHQPNVVYARIIGNGGCISITKINLIPNQTNLESETQIICTKFDQNEYQIAIDDIRSLFPQQNIRVFLSLDEMNRYQNEQTSAISVSSSLSNFLVYVRIIDSENCDRFVILNLNLLYPTTVDLENKELCPYENNISYTIPQNSFIQYIEWIGLLGQDANQDIHTNTINISNAGEYAVKIINQNGCEYIKEFTVTRKAPLDITISYNQTNILTINYGANNSNDYEYSIDQGITWQTGTIINNLPIGTYEIWIREKNGNHCLVYKETIYNDQIINFFSPNNDGSNDIWLINGFEKYEWIDVLIYNRFGKELINKRIQNSNEIWDGFYQGKVVKSESYWYILRTSDGKKFEGHVSVKTK